MQQAKLKISLEKLSRARFYKFWVFDPLFLTVSANYTKVIKTQIESWQGKNRCKNVKAQKKKNSGVFCPLIGTNFWLYTQLPKIMRIWSVLCTASRTLLFKKYYSLRPELQALLVNTMLETDQIWWRISANIGHGFWRIRMSATDFGGYGSWISYTRHSWRIITWLDTSRPGSPVWSCTCAERISRYGRP